MLGLTFKPNTDDMRDAPSLAIVQSLLDAGATVRAYDPEGMEAAKAMMPDMTYCTDAYEAANGADAVAIVTEWDMFRALDLRAAGRGGDRAGDGRSAQRLSDRGDGGAGRVPLIRPWGARPEPIMLIRPASSDDGARSGRSSVR